MAFHKPENGLVINASEIVGCMQCAEECFPHEWQAQLLEILTIPEITAYWREMNGRPKMQVCFHEGEVYPSQISRAQMEEYRDNSLCLEISGYYFEYDPDVDYCWNRPREDYYAHNPSTTWDGVRRDTYSTWVEDARMLVLGYLGEIKVREQYVIDQLADYGVVVVNDL